MSLYPDESPKEAPPQKIDFEQSSKVNEEQRKILMQLVEVMGVKELSARTDRLEQSVEQISIAMNQLIESNNKLVNMISTNAPSTTATGTATLAPNQFDKIQAIGQLAETISNAWKSFKGNDAAPSSPFGLDPGYIQERVQNSIMSNFEIGELIQNNLKSKLTQKAITQVLKDVVSHEPA